VNPLTPVTSSAWLVRAAVGLGLWLALAAGAAAATLQGVVIVVVDGDTVLFRPDQYAPASRAFMKIRLAAIDAPEANQPHGEAATRALSESLLNRRVRIETVATDDYGRTVGRIWLDDLDINAELVRQGHAWASTWRGQAELRALQAEAKRLRRGLWQDDEAVQPWVWRRQQRETTRPSASR
jgi:endonuclease YncB( thermonuclease family)